MPDFRSTLESCILGPRPENTLDTSKYSVPFEFINALYMIRDHYYKYQTTMFLFEGPNGARANFSKLGSTEYLGNVGTFFSKWRNDLLNGNIYGTEINETLILKSLGSNVTPVMYDLLAFISLTTAGYLRPGQALSSLVVGSEDDPAPIVARLNALSYTQPASVNGVATTVTVYPKWFIDINGTSVVNTQTVPTGKQIISIINDVLEGSYQYYSKVVFSADTQKMIKAIKDHSLTLEQVKEFSDMLTTYKASIADGVGFRDAVNLYSLQTFDENGNPKSAGNGVYLGMGRYTSGNSVINYLNVVKNKEKILFWNKIFPSLYESGMRFENYNGIQMSSADAKKLSLTKTIYFKVIPTVPAGTTYEVFIPLEISSLNTYVVPNSIQFVVDNWKYIIEGKTFDRNLWTKTTLPNSRFRTYLKVFTDGKVTLEYLKKIQVQDKILATDSGKDLVLFPAFLILDGDATPDPYDTNYLRINSVAIKTALTEVVSYIENQLFAQDINLLNNIGMRFSSAVSNNNLAKAKLAEEKAKLDKITSDLEAVIMEAKRIYTAYDIVVKGYASTPDPVVEYQRELEAKMKTELALFEAEQRKRFAETFNSRTTDELKTIIVNLQAKNQADLAKQAQTAYDIKVKEMELAKKQALKSETIQRVNQEIAPVGPSPATNVEYVPSKIEISEKPTTIPTQKKGSVVPLVAGVGLIALIALGGRE